MNFNYSHLMKVFSSEEGDDDDDNSDNNDDDDDDDTETPDPVQAQIPSHPSIKYLVRGIPPSDHRPSPLKGICMVMLLDFVRFVVLCKSL